MERAAQRSVKQTTGLGVLRDGYSGVQGQNDSEREHRRSEFSLPNVIWGPLLHQFCPQLQTDRTSLASSVCENSWTHVMFCSSPSRPPSFRKTVPHGLRLLFSCFCSVPQDSWSTQERCVGVHVCARAWVCEHAHACACVCVRVHV